MQILFISHASTLSHGSVKALLLISSELKRRGHNVYVVFPKQGEAIELFKNEGAITYTIPFVSSIYPKCESFKSFIKFFYIILLKNLLLNFISVIKIGLLIQRYKINIVHTNVGTVNVGLYAAKINRIPHVWHIRENAEAFFSWKPFPFKSFKHKLLHINDANILITKDLFNAYKLSERNSYVVYDGVLSGGSHNRLEANKSKYFLFVGALVRNKGLDWAIDAFLQIKDNFPDYSLKIAGVGNSSFVQELKNRCLVFDTRNQIEFLGYRTDIYNLMYYATALVVPSIYEGFGFTTVEAMYNGCLVLGRDTGGTKEQFDNGLMLTEREIGLRFDTKQELEFLMRNICENGISQYKEMIDRAQKVVLSLYTVNNNVNEILSVYSKVKNIRN